jgi:hypothetical protein
MVLHWISPLADRANPMGQDENSSLFPMEFAPSTLQLAALQSFAMWTRLAPAKPRLRPRLEARQESCVGKS